MRSLEKKLIAANENVEFYKKKYIEAEAEVQNWKKMTAKETSAGAISYQVLHAQELLM